MGITTDIMVIMDIMDITATDIIIDLCKHWIIPFLRYNLF